MGQSFFWSGGQKQIRFAVITGADQIAVGEKIGGIAQQCVHLRGRFAPLFGIIDWIPRGHGTLRASGTTLGKFLAHLVGIHAFRHAIAEGNSKIKNAGAAEETLQIFGIVQTCAHGFVLAE